MNARLFAWLSLMATLTLAYGGWKWLEVRDYQRSRAASAEQETSLPLLEEFELPVHTGETFRSADMRGKVWATTFFFSTCPGTCSRLNANIKRMTELDELADVTWLSVSVDPVTDTMPVLKKYAEQMNADPQRWLFARGEMAYLKRVGQDVLKLPVLYKDHNDYAAVVDKHGNIRGHYNALSTRDSERMRMKMLELLAEPGPAETVQRDGESSADEALGQAG